MHVKTTKNITYLEIVTKEKEKIIAISFRYLGGFFFSSTHFLLVQPGHQELSFGPPLPRPGSWAGPW